MGSITGILNLNKAPVDKYLLLSMSSILRHRGLDDEGYLFVNTNTGKYVTAGGKDTPGGVYSANLTYSPKLEIYDVNDSSYNLAFGHRRLSILDLSAEGHQPMCNEDRSIWAIYDGEVYNYVEIREELRTKGYTFQSSTDTEVIIKAYQEWGTDCLKRFNGMWSFCIWDSFKKELFCARDRFGIKPVHYYFDGSMFVFSSEIKALLQMGIRREPNEGLIFDFIKFGSTYSSFPGETFFKSIKMLPQSHYLNISLDGKLTSHTYWDLEVSNELEGSKSDANYAEDFLNLFVDSVKIRLRSDVPIGFYLSGGLDSTSIVTVANNLMYPNKYNKTAASERQKTFSVCFKNKQFDEREYIEEVIKKTNAERNYIFPNPSGFLRELDSLLWHQEEPFQGGAIYSHWQVVKRASEKGVKVLLGGQGGDEQLAGYMWFYIAYFLELLRNRKGIKFLSEFSRFFLSPEILSDFIQVFNLGGALRYVFRCNRIAGVDRLLQESFVEKFSDRGLYTGYQWSIRLRTKEEILKVNLPVFLRHEDRNSMAHSIEARNPFLDYRLVELLASFPINQKIRAGYTKYVLRNAMKGILPEKMRLRKSKIRFGMPVEMWLKTALKNDVKRIFEKPIFIVNYADCGKLINHFNKYLANKSIIYQGNVFSRFYILELWGRKFILDE